MTKSSIQTACALHVGPSPASALIAEQAGYAVPTTAGLRQWPSSSVQPRKRNLTSNRLLGGLRPISRQHWV